MFKEFQGLQEIRTFLKKNKWKKQHGAALKLDERTKEKVSYLSPPRLKFAVGHFEVYDFCVDSWKVCSLLKIPLTLKQCILLGTDVENNPFP